MAAVGLDLLRRRASLRFNFGESVSKFIENRVVSQPRYSESPPWSLRSSKIINGRSLCSRSLVQSPAEFSGKRSGLRKSRRNSNVEAEKNAVDHKSCEFKPSRGPLQPHQNSAGEFTREVEKPSAYVSSDFVDYRAMQLVFLGTSSSIATMNRSTSCIALRLVGSIFLFDCGEGAVRQILKTPMKHYDISNIFITHMHGDHMIWSFESGFLKFATHFCYPFGQIYGLPGLLCRIGLKQFQSKNPIHIYGPQGLRQWIRCTLNASHARVHPKYVVHEMILKEKASNVARSWNFVEENHADELPGKDIRRSSDGLWHIFKDDKYIVTASFLRHTIPCWGYVVEEHARRGRFDVERALEAGMKPGRYFRMLETGDSVTLACGKVVSPSDVLGPPRRGRKVVILGDTCNPKSIVAAAQEADVVVHEATVLEQDASETYQRGHSTAEMAGKFARTINAGTLVLTHFSRKLDGAIFVDERSHVRTTMKDLVSTAQRSFGKTSVIAAEDLMAITVPLVDMPLLQLVHEEGL